MALMGNQYGIPKPSWRLPDQWTPAHCEGIVKYHGEFRACRSDTLGLSFVSLMRNAWPCKGSSEMNCRLKQLISHERGHPRSLVSPKRWVGAGVGVGILWGGGDSSNWRLKWNWNVKIPLIENDKILQLAKFIQLIIRLSFNLSSSLNWQLPHF